MQYSYIKTDSSFNKISSKHFYSFRNRFEEENKQAILEAREEQKRIKLNKAEIHKQTNSTEKPVLKEGENCPECKSGMMIIRNGKFGLFVGCSNYPCCNFSSKTTKGEKRRFNSKKTKRGKKKKPDWVLRRQKEREEALKQYNKQKRERWEQYQEFRRKIA